MKRLIIAVLVAVMFAGCVVATDAKYAENVLRIIDEWGLKSWDAKRPAYFATLK